MLFLRGQKDACAVLAYIPYHAGLLLSRDFRTILAMQYRPCMCPYGNVAPVVSHKREPPSQKRLNQEYSYHLQSILLLGYHLNNTLLPVPILQA